MLRKSICLEKIISLGEFNKISEIQGLPIIQDDFYSTYVKLWSPTRKYFSSILEMLEPEVNQIALIMIPDTKSIQEARTIWDLSGLGLFSNLAREAEQTGKMYVEFIADESKEDTKYLCRDILNFERIQDKIVCVYACIQKNSLHNYAINLHRNKLMPFSKVQGISSYKLNREQIILKK